MKTNSTFQTAFFNLRVALGALLLFGHSVASPAAESSVPSAPTFIPGATALHLDGATQWMSLRYWDMGALTLESWVKLDTDGAGGPFLCRQEDLILGVADGKAYLQLELGGGNWQVLQSQQTLTPGVWYHIAGTYDKAAMKIYVDGQLDGELAATGVLFHDVCTAYWSIGAAYDRCSNRYFALFAGTVDEVRVWDYARTQDEILSTLYTSLNGDEPGLVGYWPLDEGSGQIATDKSEHGRDGTLGSTPDIDDNDPDWVTDNSSGSCLPPPSGLISWWSGDKTAQDVQGTNNGALLNGASFTKGMVGPGFLLDGIDDVVKIPNSPSLSQTRITLDAWVYPTGSHQGRNRHIISKDNELVAREYVLGIEGNTDRFNCFVQLPSGPAVVIGTTTAQLNTWYHVAMTHDGLTLRLYVNGVLEGTLDAVGDVVPTSNPVGIGGNILPTLFFQGIIDEAQIFNRALTDAEILAIYQAGTDGQCKPNIFVASIDPSYEVLGRGYTISTSVVIQDVNGIGIQDATVRVGTILPSGSALSFLLTTDKAGQADLSFVSRETGLYKFKVQKVSHPTREYDASLNIETSDTLLIP